MASNPQDLPPRNPRRRGKKRFASDRAIQSASEDLLGRMPFARALAADIRAWNNEDSLIVGLFGPWGCGKSSLKNLVLTQLRSGRAPLQVLEFNPWQFSGSGKILPAFFAELRIELEAPDFAAESAKLASRMEAYSKRLALGGTTAELAAVCQRRLEDRMIRPV